MKYLNRIALSVAILVLSISSALADDLIVTIVDDEDYPVPAERSDWVYGIYNATNSNLYVMFEYGNPAICINVYKNSEKDLVISKLCSVNPNDTVSFHLANHGLGNYKVVITMVDEDENYIGNFTIK